MTFKKYFTEKEEKQLLNKIASFNDLFAQRDHAWMEALRCTGLRIEAFSMMNVRHAIEVINTQQLNIEAIYQKRNIKHEGYVPKRGVDAFKRLLKIRKKMGFPEDINKPLVMSRNHQRLSVRSYQSRMKKWIKEAGLQEGSPHWWRHTLGKRIIKKSTAREPLLVAQRVLDHQSINSTTIYTGPDKEDVALSMEAAS